MTLVSNLKKQVDLPVWEWTRFSPVAPGAGVSCSCVADNTLVNENTGRYLYYLLNTSNFWRYDTVTDTYLQLATPPQAPANATSARFAGALGYYNRVISASSNTIVTGLPTGRAAIGYKIRIVSGTGAGQERVITDVSDPVVVDFGVATAGTQTGGVSSITDTAKNWYGNATSSTGSYSGSYTGTTPNFNGFAGYVVRIIPFGTGPNQVRKILYNTNQVLTIADVGVNMHEPFSNCQWAVTPAAGSVYQIESSTITVDTAWDTAPDQTSRFIIQSGAVLLLSNISSAAPYYSLQYYDVLHDMWYALPGIQNIFIANPSDNSLERFTENSTTWWRGKATAGSVTTLTQSDATWTTNEWAGYEIYIFSGTGKGQITNITSNTDTVLTFSTLSTAPDSTSRFEIIGYDGGKSSGSNTYITINDTAKSWTTNRWKNYAVRIMYGTGAGQTRRILSNTSTALTLYRPWTVLPDNTSVYSIQGDSDTMMITWGGSSEIYQFSMNAQMAHHGRMYDYGSACVLAALRCDANHTIYDNYPIPLTSLAGTTTITATSPQAHCLKVGDYVSIRGVTSAAADQYNITGMCQVTSVPSATTFTYTPSAAGTGTYAYMTALSTNSLTDASKDFRDNVSSSTNTSITFTRATPSNINGWYVTGTNVDPGTRVTSGAGTVTVQLSGGSAAPTGVITFSPWGPTTAITSTYSSGGGAGVATITMSANTNANITGWLVSGTNIPAHTFVASGAGTSTITLTRPCQGAVSGTITFYPPEVAGKMFVIGVSAPTQTTGNTTMTTQMAISPVGSNTGFLGGAITLPVAGTSRYVVTDIAALGANFEGSSNDYCFGVATGGSTTTIVDGTAFWATATGTGTGQGTTITLSATAPSNINGWFITGTGIATGARIISGAGTTTLTVNIPHTGAVSGTMTCCAWGPTGGSSYLVGKRVKVIAGTGAVQELTITAVAPGTGTITFGTASTVGANAVYTILSAPAKGAGHELTWVSANQTINDPTMGRYLWCARGGGVVGIDKLDLNTDKIVYIHSTPFTETLSTGSYYAYDGGNRIYFFKDVTLRLYYIDVNTGFVHGAGMVPYIAGTAGIGNRMDIFQTADRLKFLWINRHANTEHFRTLLYF